MPVVTMYLAMGMTRPRWPWPLPPHVDGMARALVYTSLVHSLRDELVGVPMMGMRHGCRKVRDTCMVIVGDGKSRNTKAEQHGVEAVAD